MASFIHNNHLNTLKRNKKKISLTSFNRKTEMSNEELNHMNVKQNNTINGKNCK